MDLSHTNSVDPYPEVCCPGPCCPMPQMGKLHIIVAQMVMYLFPCLLSFGIPFNVISVLIFMRTKMRKLTTVHYFIACGITDSINLCASFIPWLEAYNIWIYSMEGVCQIVVYLKHLSDFLSSWYLALALLDMWIGNLCSLSPKRYCTVFKTRALILAVFKLALVALLYLTWTYGPIPVSGRFLCEVIEEARDAMVVLSVMRIIFASLIPAIVVFVLIILLFSTCCRCKQDTSTRANKESIFIPLQSHRSSLSKASDRLKINRRCLTSLCLVLGLFFMLIAMPRSVIILRLTFLRYQSHGPPPMQLMALEQLTSQLYYIHFAWKFLIYFIFLKHFRSRIWKCFSYKRKRNTRENRECIVDGDLV